MDDAIVPVFVKKGIPIILSTDNNYIEYLSVALTSIVRNVSSDYNYDIVILEYGVDSSKNSKLLKIVNGRTNISLRFYNMSAAISGSDLNLRVYYTNAIYFRLYAPFLMKDYDKVIYLDCDLVVNKDLKDLYSIDLGDAYLGAVRDIGTILHYYSKGKQYIDPNYFKNQLSDLNIDNYFNSGVLLMNLKKIRDELSLSDLLSGCNKKEFMFPDQDGLNIICKENTKLLPMKWNVLPNNSGNRNTSNIQSYVPANIADEYLESRLDPYIIHYAMKEKPWKYNTDLDYTLMIKFWEYAKYSPFFKDILLNKRNALQYFEKKAIIQYLFPEENVFTVKSSNNVHFEWKDVLFFGISDLTVKYETYDSRKDKYCIQLSVIIETEDVNKYSFYFANEAGKKVVTKRIETPNRYTLKGKIIGKKYVFEAIFDNSAILEKYRLFCKYDGLSVRIIKINYSHNFPIDKLIANQYYADRNRILFLDDTKLAVEPWSKSAVRAHEKLYSKSVTSIKFRKKLFRKIYPIIKKLLRKQIWVISCNERAEDNGFSFFRYMQKQRNVKSYFLCRKNNVETFNKVKRVGHVVKEGSFKHKLLFYLADYSISSIVDNRLIRPFEVDYLRDIKANNKFVFLQHGVISQDLSREHNRLIYNPVGFITSTEDEYKSLLSGYYVYSESIVWLTGLARHDYLYRSEKKIVTLLPTWRKYLYPNLPSDSAFFLNYKKVIDNERLHNKLKEAGYKLCLRLHPLMREHGDMFISRYPDTFELYDGSYTELYAESNLLITDYSSAIYDFIYLEKPIIYYQFDYDEFYSGKHAYDHGYLDYEKSGFGEVSYDSESLVDLIIEYLDSDCALHEPYKTRMANSFRYRDNHNCERIYNKIMDDYYSR